MSTAVKKFPIASLPLPPRSHLLIHNLAPDPTTPSVPAFRQSLAEKPSLQRRARLLTPNAHFSHVSPFPLPFPFEIEPPEDPKLSKMSRKEYIEWWLAQREAIHRRSEGADDVGRGLTYEVLYSNDESRHKQETVLLALSRAGLRDCLPHLDIGDAFSLLGKGSLSSSVSSSNCANGVLDESSSAAQARHTLTDVLGARSILFTPEDAEVPFAPFSLRYSGHQFGQWAGQLGDGRAITILATPNPSNSEAIWEVQLKGAGRTPFSRSADGLAVLRSSIREYLGAEAVHALGIPTTRSLSLIALPQLSVLRERIESASITARLAPSFIRIGSFEALNPPEQLFFFGGGQQEADLGALRKLAQFVAERVLNVTRECEEGQWVREIVMECARRNGEMVAGWQAYGFMHGVINTDNVSILGLTIDYGPYAFMDVFDQMHICNHTDSGGRYAYKHQPAMILFALQRLLNALAPLIGAQSSSENISASWPDEATTDQIDEWKKSALEATESNLSSTFHAAYSTKYSELMRGRLGLRTAKEDDEAAFFAPFLTLLADQHIDFHGAFRLISFFKHSDDPDAFAARLLALSGRPEWNKPDEATAAWRGWLAKLAARIREERGDGIDGAEERCREARAHNPRFVLRQWVLEEVIARVEKDPIAGRAVLDKIMQMACSPFEPWGAEDDARSVEELDAETREERRMCGLGAKDMLGFQCSCSS